VGSVLEEMLGLEEVAEPTLDCARAKEARTPRSVIAKNRAPKRSRVM